MLTRRGLLPLIAAPLLTAQRRSRRPNIVFILTDDQGYGDLSLTGNPHVKTPNIDSLASEGAKFTHFHASPVCSPTGPRSVPRWSPGILFAATSIPPGPCWVGGCPDIRTIPNPTAVAVN